MTSDGVLWAQFETYLLKVINNIGTAYSIFIDRTVVHHLFAAIVWNGL